MVGKKGYIKTIEAMLAVVLTFAVISFILPTNNSNDDSSAKKLLFNLAESDGFRENALNMTTCVNKGDNISLNIMIDEVLSDNLNYVLCPQGKKPELPRKKVNAESYYLVPKYSNESSKIIRLYYWE